MRHLHENFHKKFKHPDLGILLWQAARATTEDVYLDNIKKMRDINEKAVDWLLKEAKPEFCVECYFEGNRYGHLTSNIAESFNSKILTAHEQPILAMLEPIRQQLMDWFTARRLLEAKTPGILVSTVLNQLNELTKRARNIVVPERVFLAYYSRLQAMKLVANTLLILIYVFVAVAHGNPLDTPAV